MTNAIRILGLDPGLRRTGWGVVAVEGARLSHVAHGVIAPDDTLPLAERLLADQRPVGQFLLPVASSTRRLPASLRRVPESQVSTPLSTRVTRAR